MHHVILWKWHQSGFREVYTSAFVNIIAGMIRRNMPEPFRIICITDDPEGIHLPTETFPLWSDHDKMLNATGRHLPSCYRRLKLFDYATQQDIGIADGDRITSIDVDTIILGSLDKLFEKIEKSEAVFAGWGVRGTYHQTVFNGSFWTFKAGPRLQGMWTMFDPQTSPKHCLSKGFLGSDQAWLSMHFIERKDVLAIRAPDFISYPREVRRTHTLPRDAKVVFFHGSRKPWHTTECKSQPWISNHWRLR